MINKEDNELSEKFKKLGWANLKDYCDTLEQLRVASHQHYLSRQTYEWKMCVAIWTPLVAIIGIILTRPNVHIGILPFGIASFCIFSIHAIWQINLKKSNDLDMIKVRKYEEIINRLLGMEINIERKGKLIFHSWSHFIYVFITFCLITTACYVNNFKRQQLLTIPNDILVWLEAKHYTSIEEKEIYIIKKMRNEMDSENRSFQKVPASKDTLPPK